MVHVWSYPPHGGMSQYSINSSLVMNSTDWSIGEAAAEKEGRGGGENAKIHETDMVAINFNNDVFVEFNLDLMS